MPTGSNEQPPCSSCDELRAQNAKLVAIVEALEKRVAELEAKLRQDSSNSNRPPSSDPPWKPRPSRPKPEGRRRGGQPGHPGASRALLPVEQVDEVVPVFPDVCGGCGTDLRRRARKSRNLAIPGRHQVVELPPIKPHVTEFQLHGVRCACGRVTRAELPRGVPASTFGPRVHAIAALLSGRFRRSCRETRDAFAELFGLVLSLGTVAAIRRRVSDALRTPYREALTAVRRASVLNVDETSWRIGGALAWLWIAVSQTLAVFHVDPRRGTDAFDRFLGRDWGTIVTDRWVAYTSVSPSRRGICWAHLIRDFRKLRDFTDRALGQQALDLAERVFEEWHTFKRSEITRRVLGRRMIPIKRALRVLLEKGAAKYSGFCKKLLSLWPSVWTFVNREGVEPTNNDAERPLRPAVLWRKGSFGSDSPAGCAFASHILTAVGSLRKQRRGLLDYFERACVAKVRGRRAPSIIPAGA